MELQIEKNVPIPERCRPNDKGYSKTLRGMSVGDSAVFPVTPVLATNLARQVFGGSGHITVRKIDRNFCRVWRIK